MSAARHRPIRLLVAVGALALPLAACSPGDVQLNGKVFDAIGGLVGAGGPNEQVKMAPRPGLVIPPSVDNLPQPGEQSVPDGQLAEIKDYDRSKKLDKSELEAKQKAYCKEHYELPKLRGDQSVDTVVGPLGPCRPSAMGLVNSINSEK